MEIPDTRSSSSTHMLFIYVYLISNFYNHLIKEIFLQALGQSKGAPRIISCGALVHLV
jgi:hypothetical protein